MTAVLTVFFASMAAFALSRLVFRGRNIAFLLIILGITAIQFLGQKRWVHYE
ncbi:hypothetical protein IAE22_28905 [Bacillus sp. S34]|nr:hypothetical protein [Bacillus sp. S34]